MTELEVQFICPECGENRLVEVREQVEQKTLVEGLFRVESPTPGSKYNLRTGYVAHSDGKVVAFRCDMCGFTLMTQDKPTDRWHARHTTKQKPITSRKHLFDWLKRHGMVRETVVT